MFLLLVHGGRDGEKEGKEGGKKEGNGRSKREWEEGKQMKV